MAATTWPLVLVCASCQCSSPVLVVSLIYPVLFTGDAIRPIQLSNCSSSSVRSFARDSLRPHPPARCFIGIWSCALTVQTIFFCHSVCSASAPGRGQVSTSCLFNSTTFLLKPVIFFVQYSTCSRLSCCLRASSWRPWLGFLRVRSKKSMAACRALRRSRREGLPTGLA